MAWTLVTPSSRGIGLSLVQHLLNTTSVPVVATARTDLPGAKSRLLEGIPSQHHSRLDLQPCDVESESSIADLAAYCADRYNNKTRNKNAHLRLGLLIPGMLHPERAPDKISYDSALATLKLNLLAPMILAKHLTPFLPRKATKLAPESGLNNSAILALMSARVGSISDNARGGWFSYRASKAGVNQLVKSLDNHLRMQNGGHAMAVGLHPGTVKTGLSKEFWESTPKEKLFSPEYAAESLLDVLRELDVEPGRGRCWDYKGEEIAP
jgi:NAD(P)-dependent dehydrogenase (short-subunit alcohol dehydrogenase family)